MTGQLIAALNIVDEAWTEYRRNAFVQASIGRSLAEIPDISFDDACRRTQLGRRILAAAETVDPAALPGSLGNALHLARRLGSGWAREEEWYWLVYDPRVMDYFAMFAPTSYGGGSLVHHIHTGLPHFRLDREGDLDRYLGLVSDYARLVRQMHARTIGQLERGIAMPAPQVAQAGALVDKLRSQARQALRVADDRPRNLDWGGFPGRVEARIEAELIPAYDAFLADIGGCLAERASDRVGLGQYPGGAEVYAELVRLQTTVDIAPEAVHAIGLARIARIRGEMAETIAAAGFDGGPADYARALEQDPAWRAGTNDELAAVFGRYIDRIEPEIGRVFRRTPAAPHGVRPLADALTGSMSFGYYNRPSPADPQGTYYFNGRNMTRQPLLNIAALTYHELEPGHHLQMAGQAERDDVHPLVANAFINAYAEGWAEYAAALAGELGMYREPPERFGKLIMDAFLTCRLVVDTGMNALGWSLEQARDFMRENAFISESEILTESIRYSCDIPAQALAYKIGDVKLMEMRAEMATRLGARFDIRDFHDAVLEPGPLPLSLVEANVRSAAAALAAAGLA
jgi:uncharacterized protein (DUF885 family)